MAKVLSVQDLKEILEETTRILKPYVREAYVFGSLVSGSALVGESDLDLLIIPKNQMDSEQVYRLLEQQVKAVLDIGLAPHIIIYSETRHGHLLKAVRAKGFRIL